jgi:hypothetical protein
MNAHLWASGRDDQVLCLGIAYPWFAHLVPLPVNCVECNGQNVDDTDSPLHGQEIPNLNAGAIDLSISDLTCRWIMRIK